MATKFITVSIEIMHDVKLNQSQKFLLAEIEQLQTLKHGCIASNAHFSELIGIAKESVSRNLSDLENKGYITIEIVNGSRNHERIITTGLTKRQDPLIKTSRPP
jgi:DNA-binding MarR family transcriptional regulator